ncbi:glutathione S-transferase 1-1-like [Lycorma delicatula]|uniref:glutathione S-transferase 1-1-like n=1 Tax=Lycorma delicatula TaxID=130591 RepID=UPI003F51675E
MPIDLYYLPGSPPCRNVILAAKALGVELNLKLTDLQNGEHLTPEFIKLNPQHNIPTLNDNGFVLNESRAIMTYLADQYGEDDKYYPKDPKKRALVNQRLYFDMGTLYQRFSDLYYPVMFGGAPFDDEKKKKLDEALGFLNTFLEKSPWAAGDNITLADLALVASVSSIEAVGYDISSYKNILNWFDKAKTTIPDYKEANGDGVEKFKQLFEMLTKK